MSVAINICVSNGFDVKYYAVQVKLFPFRPSTTGIDQMISNDMLQLLFTEKLTELAARNQLTTAETSRIQATFDQALVSPRLDERQLLALILGHSRGDSHEN